MCSFVSPDDRFVHFSTWFFITGEAFMKLPLVNSSSRLICGKIAVSYPIPSILEDVISDFTTAPISFYSFGFRMVILLLRQLIFRMRRNFLWFLQYVLKQRRSISTSRKAWRLSSQNSQVQDCRHDQAYQWLTSCIHRDGKI